MDRIPAIIYRAWKPNYLNLNKKKTVRRTKRTSKKSKYSVEVEEDVFSASEMIVNPIDLPKIKEKVKSYKSLDEFFADVQWIVHNCKVFYKGDFFVRFLIVF